MQLKVNEKPRKHVGMATEEKKKSYSSKKVSLVTEGEKNSSKHFTHLSCASSTGGASVRGLAGLLPLK